MKKLRNLIISGAMLFASTHGHAQSAYWTFPPNVYFNTSSGSGNYYPGGSNITSCTMTGQNPNTLSNSSGSMYYAFLNCGTYNSAGSQISSTYTFSKPFLLPDVCKRYYAASWVDVFGPPHYNKLVFYNIDLSTPGVVNLVGAPGTDMINDGYMHTGTATAISRKASDGSHIVFASENNTLHAWKINSGGGLYTYPLVTLPSQVENRAPMEVSSDGTRLFFLGVNRVMYQYTIATGIFTAVGASMSPYIVSGFEFVPGSLVGGSDRLYISYHPWGTPTPVGGIGYYTLSSLPSSLTNAISSYPTPNDFGFSDLEMAKDGKLYFAKNLASGPNVNGYYYISGPGQLFSLNPGTGAIAQCLISGTPIPVTSSLNTNWGYVIQDQIDGENYDDIAYTLTQPSFDLNGVQQTSSAIPDINLCPGVQLNVNTTFTSMRSYYRVQVEKSATSGGPYTLITNYIGSGTGSTVVDNITSYVGATYSGYVRVTVTAYNGCGNSAKVQTFRTIPISASIAFNMVGPYPCSSPQAKNPTPTFAAIGTVSSPPCSLGWLGAGSCAITNANATLSSGTVTGYMLEVTGPSGVIGSTYVAGATIPFNLPFNSFTSGYFNVNYNTIKGVDIFKLKVGVVTTSCGTLYDSSYFKIIDGGMAGAWWKSTNVTSIAQDQSEDISVYPNPAKQSVNLAWSSKTEGNATITIMDVSGRTVAVKPMIELIGNNVHTIDIQALTPGIYQYKVSNANGVHVGKLVKE